MNDETMIMQAGTPGFFPVMEVDGRWGVVQAPSRKIVRSGIPTEQEAREIAGTSSIRAEIVELCENAVRAVTERAVLMFENRPHTEDYELRCMIAGIRGQIERCLEVDLPKWASEISEQVRATGDMAEDVRIRARARVQASKEATDRVNEALKKLGSSVEASAQEKERDDGIDD